MARFHTASVLLFSAFCWWIKSAYGAASGYPQYNTGQGYYEQPQPQQSQPIQQQHCVQQQEPQQQQLESHPQALDDHPKNEEAPLPPGWAEYTDPESGNKYYYKEADGTTTWDRPVSVVEGEGENQEAIAECPPNLTENGSAADDKEKDVLQGDAKIWEQPQHEAPTAAEKLVGEKDPTNSNSGPELKTWHEQQQVQHLHTESLNPVPQQSYGAWQDTRQEQLQHRPQQEQDKDFQQTQSKTPYDQSPQQHEQGQKFTEQSHWQSRGTAETKKDITATGKPDFSKPPPIDVSKPPPIANEAPNQSQPLERSRYPQGQHQHYGQQSRAPLSQGGPYLQQGPHNQWNREPERQHNPPAGQTRPLQQQPPQQQQHRPPNSWNPQERYPPQYGQQIGQPSQQYGNPDTNQYGTYGGQFGQRPYLQQPLQQVPFQQESAGAVREVLGSTWQGILGFGNRTKTVAARARDSVVGSATAAGKSIGETSTSLWGSVRNTAGSFFEKNDETSQQQQPYSMSGNYRPPNQQGYPSQNFGGYPPQYQGPHPRGTPPYPHQQGQPQQHQGPPLQSQWQGGRPPQHPGSGVPPSQRRDTPQHQHPQRPQQHGNSPPRNFGGQYPPQSGPYQQRPPYQQGLPNQQQQGQPQRDLQPQRGQQQNGPLPDPWQHPGLGSDY